MAQEDLDRAINQVVNIQVRNLEVTQVEVVNLNSQGIPVENHRLHSQVDLHLLQVVVQWDLDKEVKQEANIQDRNQVVIRVELNNPNSQDILEKDHRFHSQVVHHLLQVVVQEDLDRAINQVVNIQFHNLGIFQVEEINLNSQGILVEDHQPHSQEVLHLLQAVVHWDLDKEVKQEVNIQDRNQEVILVE